MNGILTTSETALGLPRYSPPRPVGNTRKEGGGGEIAELE